MAAKRLSMRKIREVLRLRNEFGLSQRDIAKSCSIGRTTVRDYLSRASAAGLSIRLRLIAGKTNASRTGIVP